MIMINGKNVSKLHPEPTRRMRRSCGLWIIFLLAFILGCSGNHKKSDAYGNFEATEIIVSAEGNGKLMEFNVEEGTVIESGIQVGYIDTVPLSLKRDQLKATRQAISSKFQNVISQIDVLKEQLKIAMTEKQRVENLFKQNAATQKQVDDVNGQVNVIEKQIRTIEAQNSGIVSEVKSIDAQIELVNDQIRKSVIMNPVKGTVLNKFAEPHEITAYGKPLYKIADLETMFLRVYVDGDQLPHIRIGQAVQVQIDQDKDRNQTLEGEIIWISSKAEFTPKIIQTKEERVNMVYAVKVKVKNDGRLKIGMPGEVNF